MRITNIILEALYLPNRYAKMTDILQSVYKSCKDDISSTVHSLNIFGFEHFSRPNISNVERPGLFHLGTLYRCHGNVSSNSN